MKSEDIIKYYSTVAHHISAAATNREAVGVLSDGRYEARPSMIQYPSDVLQAARRGVVSFHLSVERWSSPMALVGELTKEKYDSLRIGWDFVLDIDSNAGIEAAKKVALSVCKLLDAYGLEYGIKFSGSRGFHICVAWETFPKKIDFKPTAHGYPRLPRILAKFISGHIHDPNVHMETDWGARHLFRAPLSLNEKTWLVSLPLTLQQLKSFDPSDANPETVCNQDRIEPFFKPFGDASKLFTAALDWWIDQHPEEIEQPKRVKLSEKKIPESAFPPCIRTALAGLSDGRKRSIFTLGTFLAAAGWSRDEITKRIMEWNSNNKPPLPNSVLMSQLRWQAGQRRRISPPNCSNALFYASIGLCKPDHVCGGIKNPIRYPTKLFKLRSQNVQKPQNKKIYSCDLCPLRFATPRGLSAHRSRVHNSI